MSGENTKLHAACSVAYSGGTPAYVWNSGAFTGTITDTGTGDMQLLMNANDGMLETEGIILVSGRGQPNAPRQVAFAYVHTSPTSKQLLCTEEAGVGGASVAADLNFDVVMLKEMRP